VVKRWRSQPFDRRLDYAPTVNLLSDLERQNLKPRSALRTAAEYAEKGRAVSGEGCMAYAGDVYKSKKDSPEPPRLSLKPSRLEGQLDDPKVLPGCCIRIAEP